MAQGISPNPLNDISKAYLELVAKINKDEEEKVIEKWDDSSVNKVDPDLVLKVESKRTPVTVVNTESYSDWRNDLREIVAEPEEKAEQEVKEKKGIKNKVVINPKLGEAVAEIGGQLLEVKEIDRQTVDPAERKEDPSMKSKQNRQRMLKKQVLLKKLQAVRQGAGEDIHTSYEPDGEMVEGVKSEWKKGMKRHKKAVEDKKVKERKAVPYAALAAEYEPDIEGVVEYFYEAGINEEGLDLIIEEIGLADFVDFVEDSQFLTEEEGRPARRASVRAKKFDVVKKEVDKADAERKKTKTREYSDAYAKKETDVTVYDAAPTKTKPKAKKPAAVKKVAKTPSVQKKAEVQKKAVTKTVVKKPVTKKPVTKKVVKAVAKVKKIQPAKKATKKGLGDRIRTAYKKGVERHKASVGKAKKEVGKVVKTAKATAKQHSKHRKDFVKGISPTAKEKKIAKGVGGAVKKALTREELELLEKDLNAKERRALPDKDFVFPGKGEGPEGKQRGAYPINDKKHARAALAMAAAHASPEKEAKVKAAVKKKYPGIKVSESRILTLIKETATHGEKVDGKFMSYATMKAKGIKPKKTALQSVRDKYKGQIYDPKRDKPSEADKAKAAAERKKRDADKAKAFAGRAKKAGYKNPQDYANVVARYGSEDNYRKGRGLGT